MSSLWIILFFTGTASAISIWLYFSYTNHLRTIRGYEQLNVVGNAMRDGNNEPLRGEIPVDWWKNWDGDDETFFHCFRYCFLYESVTNNAVISWFESLEKEAIIVRQRLRAEQAERKMAELAEKRKKDALAAVEKLANESPQEKALRHAAEKAKAERLALLKQQALQSVQVAQEVMEEKINERDKLDALRDKAVRMVEAREAARIRKRWEL